MRSDQQQAINRLAGTSATAFLCAVLCVYPLYIDKFSNLGVTKFTGCFTLFLLFLLWLVACTAIGARAPRPRNANAGRDVTLWSVLAFAGTSLISTFTSLSPTASTWGLGGYYGGLMLVLFTAAGLMHSGGEMDTTRANLICDTLAEHFNLNPILILPAILVLLVSVFKLPALLGMGLTVVVSIVFAMVFQGVNFVELMNYAANGFTLSTGVDIVDPMLNRGGITSMTGLLITFMVASVMGGIITATGILDVLAKDVLLKFIKSRGVLVTVTLIYCYIVNFLTAGGQTVAIIVTEQTFEDAFDRMGIHRRVLSRTLEDAGTLSAPIVPWGVATLYVMEVLGCGTEYIPYCWFIFIVPIFSILCAFSGFGIWDKDGNKMWGRKKAAAK